MINKPTPAALKVARHIAGTRELVRVDDKSVSVKKLASIIDEVSKLSELRELVITLKHPEYRHMVEHTAFLITEKLIDMTGVKPADYLN